MAANCQHCGNVFDSRFFLAGKTFCDDACERLYSSGVKDNPVSTTKVRPKPQPKEDIDDVITGLNEALTRDVRELAQRNGQQGASYAKDLNQLVVRYRMLMEQRLATVPERHRPARKRLRNRIKLFADEAQPWLDAERSRQDQARMKATKTDTVAKADSETTSTTNDGRAFEATVLELIKRLGFEADSTKVTGDGGVDIMAHTSNFLISGTYVIQCKDWAIPVGEPPVRDLLGTVIKRQAIKGVLIARSGFTPAARRFAEGMKDIDLIDFSRLQEMPLLDVP